MKLSNMADLINEVINKFVAYSITVSKFLTESNIAAGYKVMTD